MNANDLGRESNVSIVPIQTMSMMMERLGSCLSTSFVVPFVASFHVYLEKAI